MLTDIERGDVDRIVQGMRPYRSRAEGSHTVITGGGGFLGSYLADALLELGAEVSCVDNFSTSVFQNVEHLLRHPRFNLYQQDVARPLQEAFEGLLDRDVDYVLHLAARPTPKDYMDEGKACFRTAVDGTENALALAHHHHARLLFTSTSEVYGSPPDDMIPTPETYFGNVNPFGPRAVYDEGKRVGEMQGWMAAHAGEQPVDVRIVRISNTYGPRLDRGMGEKARGLMRFISQGLAGEPITVYQVRDQQGNPVPPEGHTRSHLYVTDQVDGCVRLLLADPLQREPEDLNVMNIGAAEETPMLALAERIRNLTGGRSVVQYNAPPNYSLKDDPPRRCLDTTRARTLLGWEPAVPLGEGLERTVRWVDQTRRRARQVA